MIVKVVLKLLRSSYVALCLGGGGFHSNYVVLLEGGGGVWKGEKVHYKYAPSPILQGTNNTTTK